MRQNARQEQCTRQQGSTDAREKGRFGFERDGNRPVGDLAVGVKTCHHLSGCFDRRLSTSMPKAGQVVVSGANARRAPEAGHRWS